MSQFQQFIRERQYLSNVTDATVAWYSNSLRWLPSESPTADELKATVIKMREKGLKATACNCTLRAINAYLHWSTGSDRKCGPGCTHLRVPKLKEPDLVLPTFTEQQIRQIIRWKPKGKYDKRLHLLALFLLDTGCRISEALHLRMSEIDLNNLLVTLDGKGRKQRIVPISIELRKAIYKYAMQFGRKGDSLLLANRSNAELTKRNALRDVKRLCVRLGFAAPIRTLHAFRHTFAVNYLRRGGSVFHLQKCLGHSSLEMTRRYANLVTGDLQAVHEKMSLLRGFH